MSEKRLQIIPILIALNERSSGLKYKSIFFIINIVSAPINADIIPVSIANTEMVYANAKPLENKILLLAFPAKLVLMKNDERIMAYTINKNE